MCYWYRVFVDIQQLHFVENIWNEYVSHATSVECRIAYVLGLLQRVDDCSVILLYLSLTLHYQH